MYEYKIKTIDHIVDGDTFDCSIDLGFNISHKIRVRMYGINTPESRTRDLEEKARGLASKKRLIELLEEHEGNLILATKEKGKYGRYLGIVYAENVDGWDRLDINGTLIKEGYAVEYFGGKR
jgi:micrococcal nuclease